MTSSPNTDGQLGMEDITIHDDILYQSCMEWESKKKRLEGLSAKQTEAAEARDAVLGALDISNTEKQRFVIRRESEQLEGEPLQYVINTSPPGEPHLVEEHTTQTNLSARLSAVGPE